MAKEGEAEFKRSGINPAANSVYIPSFALRSYDDTNATESGYGNAFKEEKFFSYEGKLRGEMLAARLGVNFIDNLTGNLNIVTGGADAAWVAEDVAATKAKPAYAKMTLSPKRLQVLQGVTYDLIHQNSASVDALIMADMVKAHAAALDAAIFAGSGSSGQPTGVLGRAGNTVSIGDTGGAITYAKLVEMEQMVGEDNGLLDETLAYVSNAKVMGKLKTIPQVQGYPWYLLNEGKVNGYPFFMSNALPSNLTKGTTSGSCSAAIFGPFSQVICGTWGGGLQFIIDPYTAKASGVLEVTAIAYHDVAVRHADAFAKIVDITTA
jgi:HK97 family phage major capsid protein